MIDASAIAGLAPHVGVGFRRQPPEPGTLLPPCRVPPLVHLVRCGFGGHPGEAHQ